MPSSQRLLACKVTLGLRYNPRMKKSQVAQEIWGYLKVRKKFWLLPLIVILVLLGAVVLLTEGAAVAPFIYTLF